MLEIRGLCCELMPHHVRGKGKEMLKDRKMGQSWQEVTASFTDMELGELDAEAF